MICNKRLFLFDIDGVIRLGDKIIDGAIELYDLINKKGGRKKLKKFFVDSKIPKETRDNILLLADGSEIVWIVGYRISEKYKVTKETKNILKIIYNKE